MVELINKWFLLKSLMLYRFGILVYIIMVLLLFRNKNDIDIRDIVRIYIS